MRALVTGAAGFIGSRLTARLLSKGWGVTGIDVFRPTYDVELKWRAIEPLTEPRGVELIQGDLAELALADVLRGVDVVFHLAARASARASWRDDFELYLHDNVRATERLLRAAHTAAVGRVVFASSSSVYGDAGALPLGEDAPLAPVSPYGVTKVAGEQLARAYGAQGLDVICLRYFTVYGPGQRPDMAVHRFIDSALHGGEVPVYGDGRQTRDFTYVDDTVAGTIAAAARGRAGRTYNVAGGVRASVAEVVELVGAASRVIPAPVQAGDVHDTAADTSRARAELGFTPRWSLRDGLREQVAWQRLLTPAPSLA